MRSPDLAAVSALRAKEQLAAVGSLFDANSRAAGWPAFCGNRGDCLTVEQAPPEGCTS